jgi:hypothetical protein
MGIPTIAKGRLPSARSTLSTGSRDALRSRGPTILFTNAASLRASSMVDVPSTP